MVGHQVLRFTAELGGKAQHSGNSHCGCPLPVIGPKSHRSFKFVLTGLAGPAFFRSFQDMVRCGLRPCSEGRDRHRWACAACSAQASRVVCYPSPWHWCSSERIGPGPSQAVLAAAPVPMGTRKVFNLQAHHSAGGREQDRAAAERRACT